MIDAFSENSRAAMLFFGVVALLCATAISPAIASQPGDVPVDLAPLSAADLHTLETAFDVIKNDYAGHVDDEALMTSAIKGMVSSLDPHSEFFSRDEFSRLHEQLDGGFAGVGLQVGMEDGRVRVYAPLKDTPAEKAGIRAGDFVTYIDDTPTQGLTLAEAVKRMRGAAGTHVRLTLYRTRDDETKTYVVTRALIHSSSVTTDIPIPGYAYIRISSFDEQTITDLATRLRPLAYTRPPLKGLVLDLRSNGGGVLQDGVGVASAFLPPDTVVVTSKERKPDSGHTYRTTYVDYRRTSFTDDPLAGLPVMYKTLPLVVLVNAQSVSVTEVVSAALQDTRRAVIMGQPTFGKGTIQVTGAVQGGAGLMLTVARYYTPSGRSIQNCGVVPDLMVDAYPDGDVDALPAVREIDLANHLANPLNPNEALLEVLHQRDVLDTLRTVEAKQPHESSPPRRPGQRRPPVEFGKSNDFVLKQALNWLRGRIVLLSKAQSVEYCNGASGNVSP
ncbi:S41 family peptidase [Trinickia violacea]|uniref:S41 family peptidase n=1 Tax=Trinickia violacea TaxID=2571746 RepID=UPI001586D0B0|nr:S41 family peptidase [Trinickia violacea]